MRFCWQLVHAACIAGAIACCETVGDILGAQILLEEQLSSGQTWKELVDLQRGLHGACLRQRLRKEGFAAPFTEVGSAFLASCL